MESKLPVRLGAGVAPFPALLQGEKDSKVCILEYLFLFLHLNLEILLKGMILKDSISTSAFGCPYVSLPR